MEKEEVKKEIDVKDICRTCIYSKFTTRFIKVTQQYIESKECLVLTNGCMIVEEPVTRCTKFEEFTTEEKCEVISLSKSEIITLLRRG